MATLPSAWLWWLMHRGFCLLERPSIELLKSIIKYVLYSLHFCICIYTYKEYGKTIAE